MMTSIIATTIKSGLDIIILIGAVSGFLLGRPGPRSLKFFRRVSAAVLAAAVSFTFVVRPGLDRQSYDLGISLVSALALALLLFLIWIRVITDRRADRTIPSGGRLTATVTAVAYFGPLSDLLLVPAGFAAAAAGPDYLTTEIVGKIAVFSLALIMGAGLAAILALTIGKLRPVWAAAWLTLGLLPMIVMAATGAVQMLLVGGVIAASPPLFSLVARLINSRPLLQNMILAAALLPAVLSVINPKRAEISAGELNPAQKRLVKAGRRRELTSVTALVLLTLVVGLMMGADKVFAEKEVELNPAKPVEIVDGSVRIPIEQIKDKKLHRFSVGKDGANIRFIVVHKGSGVYGTGLDACQNCGPVGYYEKDGNIVCKNCEAYINVETLGLPGGCNPLPLKSAVKAGYLVIEEKELVAAAGDEKS